MRWTTLLLSAATTATVASLATTAALAALSRMVGNAAVRPINATSHWLHGDNAGKIEDTDMAHTGLGYATHHASALFWALPFECWLSTRPPRRPLTMLRDAGAMAAIAATVDYGLVPKRLTPGWEEALPKRSVAATFGVLAIGLAAGALLSQSLRGGFNYRQGVAKEPRSDRGSTTP